MRVTRFFIVIGAASAISLGLAAPALAATDTKGCDYTIMRGSPSALKMRVIATTNISCPNAVRATMRTLDKCSSSASDLASAARRSSSGPITLNSRCRHEGYQCRMRMRVRDNFSGLLDGAVGVEPRVKRGKAAASAELVRMRMTLHCMKGPKRRFGTTLAFSMGFYFKQAPTLS